MRITILIIFFLFIAQTICNVRLGQSISSVEASKSKTKPKSKTSNSDGGWGVLGCFIIGPILFICSFAGVWFNEKRAAVNYHRLNLVKKLLNENSSDQSIQMSTLNDSLKTRRLAHRTGMSEIIQPANDEQIHLILYDAIVIDRIVEVKQTRATKKSKDNNNEDDEYNYNLEWVSENQYYAGQQTNPYNNWFIKSKRTNASRVHVAGYRLNQQQLNSLQCTQNVSYTPELMNTLQSLRSQQMCSFQPITQDDYIYYPGQNSSDIQSKGSLRVKIKFCKSQHLSIISAIDQSTHNYQPFRIDIVDNNGQDDQACDESQCCICCTAMANALKPMKEVNFIMKGILSYQEMIRISIQKNSMQTNLFRLGFFFLMVLGIVVFFSPLSEILGYIPLVGGFLKSTAMLIIILAAFIISIPLFIITFGLAWMRYHPLIGGITITLSVILMFIISSTGH